jgi:hypothetical protein
VRLAFFPDFTEKASTTQARKPVLQAATQWTWSVAQAFEPVSMGPIPGQRPGLGPIKRDENRVESLLHLIK